MMSVIILAFAAILVVWVYAEFKLGRNARLVFGVLSIGGAVLLTYSIAQLSPVYESAWHRSSIKAAAELLAHGETNRVQEAFATYNSMVATASTFRASEEMWHVLKHDATH